MVQSVRSFLISILFIGISSGHLYGQVIRGQVIDFFSREPLPGTNVLVDSTGGTTTDSVGNFRYETSRGLHVIQFSFIGYQEYITVLNLKDTEVFMLIELRPEESELGEVVVSAGKYQQRLEEVTVSLDVINPKLVQDKNQVNLKNTLQQATGVNVTDGQANIRSGSGWTYGAGTRVQTLVDGMPLISGDANQVQWDLVPIHSVERIEVLKGASSVLYGSAALNGVVNMLTHPFPEKEHLNLNLYSGVYDNPRQESLHWWEQPRFNSGFNFDWQKPLSEYHALNLSGGYIDDQGFRYLDDEKRVRLFGKYHFRSRRIRNLEGSLAAHLMYSDVGNSLLWESDSLGYIPLDSSITRNFGWDYYLDAAVNYRHGRFRHSIQGRYLKINNITFDDQTDFTNRSDLVFGEYRLQYYVAGLSASLGFNTSHSVSDAVLFDGRHSSSNNALFLEVDYRPWKPLKVNAGIRYESFRLDDRFYDQPVFRAGINYAYSESVFLRLSYGQAFRFPSIAESFTTTRVGVINVYPNPKLSPELGSNIELGARKVFKKERISGYFDFAGFIMRYDDMIEYNASFWGEFRPPLFGFGFIPLNIGETRISGLEYSVALEGEFNKTHYRLLAGYTFTFPEIMNPTDTFATDSVGFGQTFQNTSSNPENGILKYRYQHLVKLDLQLERGPWSGGISLRLNDFMQNIDSIFVSELLSQFVPGVENFREKNKRWDTQIDLRLGYRIRENWQISLIIDNLLNQIQMIRPAYLGPPRMWTIRMNYLF